jgi:signal transduction histidine kinase
MLHEFVSLNRDEIIRRCRAKVAERLIPAPTELEINHGVPLFLDQLVTALRHHEAPNPEIRRSAALHGRDLLKQGFTVGQVVHDYGDVCQSITQLAVETNARISAEEFRRLNLCLDDAIADAVTAYGHDCNQSTLADETARGSTQMGFFAHELRNLIQTLTIAFEVLKQGNVGVAGSTAAVISRSLVELRSLVDKSITDVRITRGLQHPTRFAVVTFVEELALAARLLVDGRDVTVKVTSDDSDAEAFGDQQNLAAAVRNLLQNGIKFTRPKTTVTLRTSASVDRVLIEVHDECGGLPDGKSAELFHPFEQRGSDRTGLGLGLAYSQWAVVANGGRIYVRDLPGKGCVFVVDLPRHVQQPVKADSVPAAHLRSATLAEAFARPEQGNRTRPQ